jgi:hypothetical protein
MLAGHESLIMAKVCQEVPQFRLSHKVVCVYTHNFEKLTDNVLLLLYCTPFYKPYSLMCSLYSERICGRLLMQSPP